MVENLLSEEEFRVLMESHHDEAVSLARWLLWPETYQDPRGEFLRTLEPDLEA